MNDVPTKSGPTPADLEALASNFESFVRATEELRASYERLRERAERIDTELADANGKLRDKVEELDHLSGHLNGILAAIPTGVVVTDSDGKITMLNAAAELILELPAETAVGRRPRELTDRSGKTLVCGPERLSSEIREEPRVVSLSGTKVLGGDVSPIVDREGAIVGHVETVEDLSEVWNLKEKVHHLDKLAALGEMSAVIAHEIRNPLNGAHGFANLLAKRLGDQDEKSASYASKVVQGLRDVDQIITELLEFASPKRFHPRVQDLIPVIDQAFASALQRIPVEEQSKFELYPDWPGEAFPVSCDPVKMNQVFWNLFSNAVDSMPRGGRIHVAASRDNSSARIRIQDEGEGIPEESLDKVFDPFFTTKTQGTGLGLAIVRKIVELHGGSIRAEESDQGACFAITLPAARPEKG